MIQNVSAGVSNASGDSKRLSPEELLKMDAYWRSANFRIVGNPETILKVTD